jgi:diketogulonate reductase-like aldo/keto reductase
VAEQQRRTTAQVALRWLVQKKIIAIPKASSQNHLKDNLDVFDWQLDDAQMDLLDNVS